MSLIQRLILFVPLIFGASPAFALDNFPGTTLTGTAGTITGSTTTATGETGEPASIGGGSVKSIWYSWTAPASGLFTIATCNLTGETTTNFDSTLRTMTGTAVNALTQIAVNDDTAGCETTSNPGLGYAASNAVTVTAGTTYRFQVEGYGNTSGNYTLRWGLAALAINVTDNSATEGGDTASFTVVPTSPPAGGSNIVVAISTSPQCTFAPTSLTFSDFNFTTPQTVTVTAIDDTAVEGLHSCLPASIIATGGGYTTTAATPPTITVNDNERPSLLFLKSWVFATPAGDVNGNGIADVGDKVTYSFTANNDGNTTLANIQITESFLGAGTPPVPAGEQLSNDAAPTGDSVDAIGNNSVWSTLAPGDAVTFRANYTVTQADVDNQ
jgi:uncharacterized repeat protein (TIGR01451 family)